MQPEEKLLIDIQGLNKYYQVGDYPLHVLKDINLKINAGDFVSVMGPSGSGKSTLINVLGFLDNHYEGEYLFQGKTVTGRSDNNISHLRNQMVGFIFQDFNLIENMTVRENVRLPLIYGGANARQTEERVKQVLSDVGLAEKINVKPYELSGGQRQRVAIARALVNKPQFIIADEPTGALDTKTSQAIMEILSDLHQRLNTTIVMVTHDPTLQKYANKHIVIVDGQVSQVSESEANRLSQHYQALEKEAET